MDLKNIKFTNIDNIELIKGIAFEKSLPDKMQV